MEKHVFLPGRRGFTLIELMVVVAIIGILMAAGIVMFSDAQKVARDAKRRADMEAIAKAQEQYYQDNGEYFSFATTSNLSSWNNIQIDYFPSQRLPIDPINNASYAYIARSLRQNTAGHVNPKSRFCFVAVLEIRNGNCAGSTGTSASDPNSYQCNFVPPGTGRYYCVQDRQ